MKRRAFRRPLVLPAYMMLSIIAFVSAAPAQEEDVRDLGLSSWYKNRKSKGPQAPKARPKYKRKDSVKVAPPNSDEHAEVGITIWRLRPSRPSDDKETRELVYGSGGKKEEWTPERIETMSPLAEGDKVRLSIESPREGHLYVINRARYADGGSGPPYLIFPILSIRNGENRLLPGSPIEIPPREGEVKPLELKRSISPNGAEETSEELIVIVASRPIPGIRLRGAPLKLSQEQLESWQKQWGTKTERWELIDGAGNSYTKAEKDAADGKRELTREDPFPQTIYRTEAKSGQPVIVSVQLPIGK